MVINPFSRNVRAMCMDEPSGSTRRRAGRGRRRGVLMVMAAIGLALSIAGCASARAETVVVSPPLEVPPPPPRVLAPVPEPIVATAVVPDEPTTAVPPAPPPAAPRRSNTAGNGTEPRQDPAPEPPPQPAEAATSTEPARVLRATPAAEDPLLERKVRDLLTRAEQSLRRVDYGKLSQDGKSQYDEAKSRFDRAEAALKDKNFQFALTLADTAATLAAQLPGAR